jgi:prevent-host-death family protein
MKIEIGAYDAKTRLPELLRQVKAGKRFTITNRGAAIADLVPSEAARAPDSRAAIEKFQAFLRDNPVKPGRKTSTKSLIEEGRE